MAKKPRTKKSKKSSFWASEAGKKTFIVILAIVAFASLALVIKLFPDRGQGSKDGVGADGFSVFVIDGADLGITDVVKKPVVEAELGSQTKSIDDVQKTKVISYNGDKGQTATYYLTTKNGMRGSFYVDVMEYKSQAAYNDADTSKNTTDAGKINGNEARYMKAAIIANELEYALLVTKDTKSYKFALTQSIKNAQIDESTARAALINIARQASL